MLLFNRMIKTTVLIVNVYSQLDTLGLAEMDLQEQIVFQKILMLFVSNHQKSNGVDHFYTLMVIRLNYNKLNTDKFIFRLL